MQFEHVPCPHCGLLCDDLTVEVNDLSLQVVNTKHSKCTGAYADASIQGEIPSPQIDGKPTTLAKALEKATSLLRDAQQPLVHGLITDIQGAREAVALTEKISGVIDHMNSAGIRKNTSVIQRIGKVKTTLAEVKNRADMIVIFGDGVLPKFPRLVERILSPQKTLGAEGSENKKIIILNPGETAEQSKHPEHENITRITIPTPSIESMIHSLQNIVMNEDASNDANDSMKDLIELKQQILNSHYTTFIWTGSEFAEDSAEYTIQTITQIIKELTQEVRCAGLPLGGSKAEITASQVATWQTGSPLPVTFMDKAPSHDPIVFNGTSMIENNEADCVLWVSTYNSQDIPPETDIPMVVLGHPNMKFKQQPAVYIPVGVPGIDHRGLACRTDNVATLPLLEIRTSSLPAASEILRQITQLI